MKTAEQKNRELNIKHSALMDSLRKDGNLSLQLTLDLMRLVKLKKRVNIYEEKMGKHIREISKISKRLLGREAKIKI